MPICCWSERRLNICPFVAGFSSCSSLCIIPLLASSRNSILFLLRTNNQSRPPTQSVPVRVFPWPLPPLRRSARRVRRAGQPAAVDDSSVLPDLSGDGRRQKATAKAQRSEGKCCQGGSAELGLARLSAGSVHRDALPRQRGEGPVQAVLINTPFVPDPPNALVVHLRRCSPSCRACRCPLLSGPK